MGYDFALHVNEYLKSKGYETRSIAKIDSNPDKSKHLETATTKLFDQEIDFVNLRNEVYNEDSRIPAEVVSAVWQGYPLIYCDLKNWPGLGSRRMAVHPKMHIDETSRSTPYFSMFIRSKLKIIPKR